MPSLQLAGTMVVMRTARSTAGIGAPGVRASQAAALMLLGALSLQGCGAASGPDTGPSQPTLWCGDGLCSGFETRTSCPSDCAPAAGCDDGVCSAGETCASCPADCGAACVPSCDAVDIGSALPILGLGGALAAGGEVDAPVCGGGAIGPVRRLAYRAVVPGRYHVAASGNFPLAVQARFLDCSGPELECQTANSGAVAAIDLELPGNAPITIEVTGLDGGEGSFTIDITLAPALCGDGLCTGDETCTSCPADCGSCQPPAACGDGVCQPGEGCGSCTADCGSCTGPACGDGRCDVGEDCGSCPFDCGFCQPTCGDGVCDPGESCDSCEFDCGSCPPPPSSCGDGFCDADEDCASCASDCGDCSPSPDPWSEAAPGNRSRAGQRSTTNMTKPDGVTVSPGAQVR